MKIKNVRYKNLMGQGSYQLIRPMGDLSDHPEFQPYFSSAQMLAMGIFEGLYLNSCQDEYPAEWFKNARLSESADPAIDYFGVKSRTSLQHWRAKGWITEHDPRGWFELFGAGFPFVDGSASAFGANEVFGGYWRVGMSPMATC